jgi:hypothetical protein
MKVWALSGISAIAIVALVGCQTTEERLKKANERNLTNAELTEMFSIARDATWTNPRGSSGTISYKPDGRAAVNWGSGGDTGVWRVVDNTFCQKWKSTNGGKEHCMRVYRGKNGGITQINLDGSERGTMKFQ